MNPIRLFNNDAGETLNEQGRHVDKLVNIALEPLMGIIKKDNLSVLDFKTIVTEWLACECAIEQIHRGISQRKQDRQKTP